MTGIFRPVLSVPDPESALDWFGALSGVAIDRVRSTALCGDLRIAIQRPDRSDDLGFRSVAIDHLALRVGDVDWMLGQILAAGGRLDPAFTPHGPREIDEFWGTGVRFVFVLGPGGVPLEICQRRNVISETKGVMGLDHIGLRTPDTAKTCAQKMAAGAVEIARYSLKAATSPVAVSFLSEANLIWEVFDEPEVDRRTYPPSAGVWKGVVLERQA